MNTPPISDEEVNSELKKRWNNHLKTNPRTRIRSAATALGVTELELVETDLGSSTVRLSLDFRPFLHGIESLGRAMALTRNESCVIETYGKYTGIQIFDHAAQVVAPGVDLRIFPKHWVYAYAISKKNLGRVNHSIQIFDANGTATHKVYVPPGEDLKGYNNFVKKFQHPDQNETISPNTSTADEIEKPDHEIEKNALLEGWKQLRDTHDFQFLLRKFNATRTQALRMAEGTFTRSVSSDSARKTLQALSKTETPIMIFVGNSGTIQIHSGLVNKTLSHKQWYNVMDPEFNLHLDEPSIVSAWVVSKPGGELGTATSLELYDKSGKPIVMFFGLRKPGEDHGPSWNSILEEIE
ncbi:MAG: hemin-degrading factor [Gemmatimonadetes bacterium]|nr:hemin-degrading factor [Gemmatimonadota bacterium]|tara:strand:+ start:3684 stop:4742 length:1059 start_codon:yes stop_codon:yes gene_type:complete